MTRYARLEASRSARAGFDPFANVPTGRDVKTKRRSRVTSSDGLRFEYAGTEGARRNFPTHTHLTDPAVAADLKRRYDASGFGKPYARGRGIGAMSAEKRRAQSKLANAARWAK